MTLQLQFIVKMAFLNFLKNTLETLLMALSESLNGMIRKEFVF